MDSINPEDIVLKSENESLWIFIESVIPFIKENVDYIKLCQNDHFTMARYRQIESVLIQRKNLTNNTNNT